MLDCARRVIFSEHCASVWSGLVKRDTFGHLVTDDYLPIYALLANIGMAVGGPSDLEKIPKSERKSGGERMVKLIRKLRDEISLIIYLKELPNEFVGPAYEKAKDIVNAFYSSGFEEANLSAKKSSDEKSFDEQLVKEGAAFSILMAPDVLDAWEKGAIAWSKSTPAIYRPNAAGVDRAYFVRKITDHFLSMYRTPFREHTLALTSVFFDCSTLDASAIAKLAPCAEAAR
jgi:hypothetical protein